MQNLENLYKEALDNAVASVEIEGYSFTESQKKFCFEFVSGKITKEDFIRTIIERCKT